MEIKVDRTEVIRVLEYKLEAARAFDEMAAFQHKVDVERCAQARRVWLNRLLSLPNRELAELDMWSHWTESREDDNMHGARCPLSVEQQLQTLIDGLSYDNRKTLTINAGVEGNRYNGTLDWAWNWTPEKINRTVC